MNKSDETREEDDEMFEDWLLNKIKGVDIHKLSLNRFKESFESKKYVQLREHSPIVKCWIYETYKSN
ncbi:MAG: hypothetical protein ACXAB7_11470 [Candidatus Kariarchaeaceae archaeon]|jgi:hypothetical protein